MRYRLLTVVVIAGVQVVIDGFILLLALWTFAANLSDREITLAFFRRFGIWTTKELQENIFINCLFSIPTFAGAVGVLRFREWARRLLIVGSVLSLAYLLVAPLLTGSYVSRPTVFEPSLFIPVLWYLWICYFFSWPSVRRNFK